MTIDSPIHYVSPPHMTWATANTSEALPGVQSPLGWTYWDEGFEIGYRGALCDLGILPTSEVRRPTSIEERFNCLFYGRYACYVQRLAFTADRALFMTGDDALRGYCGITDRKASDRAQRLPIVYFKFPWLATQIEGRLRRVRAETHAWWHASTRPGALPDAATARVKMKEGVSRFMVAMRHHAPPSWYATLAYQALGRICTEAGLPGYETELSRGYGSLEEANIVKDIWRVSRGQMTIDACIEKHGYHGPLEGELASHSWREDKTPLQRVVDLYAGMKDDASPLATEAGRARDLEEKLRQLRGALPFARRLWADAVLAFAKKFTPLREVGKAAFLEAIDVGRAAARVLGDDYHRKGLIDTPDDVFYLTYDEVQAPNLRIDAKEVVARRRKERAEFEKINVPGVWTGEPTPIVIADETKAESDRGDASAVKGMGVSAGRVTARARVVEDIDDPDMQEGEVLVCKTTDPGWAPLFLVAGGLVIDIGGPISHGAIIARELGVPCVINTGNGTRVLKTGDLITIDGTTGTVTRES